MTEALAVIKEEEHGMSGPPGSPTPSQVASIAAKHPHGFPKNIERMFETFHQTPTGEFKPTFYNPFEIKHRRRTSKDQFQVLETSFQDNSKPNATVRRALAQRLGMTPRAVQVWFQNRRAKMKVVTGGSGQRSELDVESPHLGGVVSGTDTSANCSSLASPDMIASQMGMCKVPSAANQKKNSGNGGALGRRHSMPNMAQPPIITNEHFKQLHEAIFGGHMITPHLSMQQQNLSYQIPMKPGSHSFDQGYSNAATTQGGYYPPPGYPSHHMHSPQVHAKQRNMSAYPMMPLEAPMEGHEPSMNNDIDFFLQSIIVPPGSAAAQQAHQQQQLFLSSLMQADPNQIPGLTENLASFLCPNPSGHGESHQQNGSAGPSNMPGQNDSYLLSKYMNDERFAD